MSDIELRIQRLEDIEAIKQLKARYFASCDAKRVEDVKACFLEGDVLIDYGPVGCFTHRDQLINLFQNVACHAHMVEMHHGQNPQIEIVSINLAKASWGLFYHLINKQEGTVSQLGGYYQDEYQRVDQQWKIKQSIFTPTSSLIRSLNDASVLFAGNPVVHA